MIDIKQEYGLKLSPLKQHILFFTQILWKVDTILFSLLILQGLSDSQGRVWKSNPSQCFVVEATMPQKKVRQLISDLSYIGIINKFIVSDMYQFKMSTI